MKADKVLVYDVVQKPVTVNLLTELKLEKQRNTLTNLSLLEEKHKETLQDLNNPEIKKPGLTAWLFDLGLCRLTANQHTMNTITEFPVLLKTDLHLGDKLSKYSIQKIHEGKVRDSYFSNTGTGDRIVVTTDRVSAFDVVLPFGIPGKGAILTQISNYFMEIARARDIVPCWTFGYGNPNPQISIGRNCEPFKIEMIVRGYLCGSAWRAYKNGARSICGQTLPEGLKENDKLPNPIITPTTKAEKGNHDEDITPDSIVTSGLCTQIQYYEMATISLKLFEMGTQESKKAAMILVDTKFEFGLFEGKIYLIDELLTPDSSRYFDLYRYNETHPRGEKQEDLSKEYLRKLLMERGFEGKEGQVVPEITQEEIEEVSARYHSVYHRLTGKPLFLPTGDGSHLSYPQVAESFLKEDLDRWFVDNRRDRGAR